MKTIQILLVAVLLAASTTLMANTSMEESIALRQTEQLVKPLNLSKKQTKKILAINQNYVHRTILLLRQRKELQALGYMDATVEQNYLQTFSNRFDTRALAIKAVLKNDQLVAYTTMLPELKKDQNKSMRFMRERTRDRFDS
jgi:hypothetical protein